MLESQVWGKTAKPRGLAFSLSTALRKNTNRRDVLAVAVKLRDGESFDSLLRRFNKEVMDGGVMKDLRRRRWFVPKGEQRRMDERKGRRRARMQRMRQEHEEG
jgi:small subunit ribosomal protein S21